MKCSIQSYGKRSGKKFKTEGAGNKLRIIRLS